MAQDSVLNRIVVETAHAVAIANTPFSVLRLEERAAARPPARDFLAALRQPGLGLIAEVKKGSPAKGPFARNLDHVAAARAFRDGGAVAISVLTSPAFFAGPKELDDVATALAQDQMNGGPACPPLLRKEFILDPYQVLEARALGADAYLVIAKTIDSEWRLADLVRAGRDHGMAAFVEVTTEEEVRMALRAQAPALGINNRDLHTFTEDLSTTERLRPLIPPEIPVVAASGVRTRADLERMRAAGVDAVLIGEALTTSSDIPARIRELFSV